MSVGTAEYSAIPAKAPPPALNLSVLQQSEGTCTTAWSRMRLPLDRMCSQANVPLTMLWNHQACSTGQRQDVTPCSSRRRQARCWRESPGRKARLGVRAFSQLLDGVFRKQAVIPLITVSVSVTKAHAHPVCPSNKGSRGMRLSCGLNGTARPRHPRPPRPLWTLSHPALSYRKSFRYPYSVETRARATSESWLLWCFPT